jgi:hypothetical protein
MNDTNKVWVSIIFRLPDLDELVKITIFLKINGFPLHIGIPRKISRNKTKSLQNLDGNCNPTVTGINVVFENFHFPISLANGFDDKLQTVLGDAVVKTGVILVLFDEKGIQIGLGVLNRSLIGLVDANDVVGVDV